MTEQPLEERFSGLPVQIGMTLYLAASFFVMFALGTYEPGVGASGPGSGIGLAMFGGYFLACSVVFRGYFLYRLKIMRITSWFGEDSAFLGHGLYGFAGLAFIGLGGVIAMR